MKKFRVYGTHYIFVDGVIEAPDAETAYQMAKDDASLCDIEVGGDWSVDGTLTQEIGDSDWSIHELTDEVTDDE